MVTRHRTSARIGLWLMAALWLSAADAQTRTEPAPSGAERPSSGTAPEAADAEVSLEFLEFLGEWETSTGEWLDPTELDTDDGPPIDDGVSEAQ